MAEAGADVAFCARGKARVDELVDALDGAPGAVFGYVTDMSDGAEIDRFLDVASSELGPPDILVNNVGQSPSRNFLHMTDEDWESLFRLNLMSAVRCTRRLLPAMRKQSWGRVVMVATAGAKHPSAVLVDYAASKAALVATGKALARKYAADNVLINSVLPGLIRTPMWERAAAEIAEASSTSSEAVFANLAKQVPLGRYGRAGEVANVILFLCPDLATYLAGTAIAVDGGADTTIF
jgi:3-oxoacyl-[acyl-carrier protein] reductase